MKLKSVLVSTILWFLGKGFESSFMFDSQIKREVETWEDGMTLLLSVGSKGPSTCLRKQDGRIKPIAKEQQKESPDMAIYFKNTEAALLVLTGRIGIAQAFAEHRFLLKGDIAAAMSVVRCMNIVENYLFPSFMTRKILKRIPQKEVSSLVVYRKIILGI